MPPGGIRAVQPPLPPSLCCALPKGGGRWTPPPFIVGKCTSGALGCQPGMYRSGTPGPIQYKINAARDALTRFIGGADMRAGIFVGSRGYPDDEGAAHLRSVLPGFPWTTTRAPWQLQAYLLPVTSTAQPVFSDGLDADLGLWILYPTDDPPIEFMDPAHPPFDGTDKLYGVPPAGQRNTGPVAKALESAMYLFFPDGKFDWGGDTPGRITPGLMVGSYFGGRFPSAYWLRTVSQEMVDFAVDFLTKPNPYDGQIGFGPEVNKHFSVGGAILDTVKGGAAGAKIGAAYENLIKKQKAGSGSAADAWAAAAAQGAQIGAAGGGGAAGALTGVGEIGALVALGSVAAPYGAAIAAGIGATVALLRALWDTPEPKGWVKQLRKMTGLWRATGAWYWTGQAPPWAMLDPKYSGFCTRLWPYRLRGGVGVDPRLAFGYREPDWPAPEYPGPTPVGLDFSIALPRPEGDPLWTPLEAYAEVMRRVAGVAPPSQEDMDKFRGIPWGWIVAGLLLALGAGATIAIVARRKKAAAPAPAPATKGLYGRRGRRRR